MNFRFFITLISSCALTCGAFSGCSSSSSDGPSAGAAGSSTGGMGSSGKGSTTAGKSSQSIGGGHDSSGGETQALGGAGNGSGGQASDCVVDASYMPSIDRKDFVVSIDNPYWPLVPGTKFVFEGGGEYVEVTVSNDEKEILGIPVLVVRDTLHDGAADAAILEDTYDWYAQDKHGNVWYMGEDTKEYEGDKVTSTAGSWEAGVNGAQPGIVMHAKRPPFDTPYRQEYLACEAEDFAELTSIGEAVSVPFGDFTDCIKTHETTPLKPDLNEYKFYCAGVGLVAEEDVVTGDRVELTQMIAP